MRKESYLTKMGLSSLVKRILQSLGAYQLSDSFSYHYQQLLYHRRNKAFFSHQPTTEPVPDPYTLYESYKLDYRQYLEDGAITAREILEELLPLNRHQPFHSLLDLGCGPVRLLRHFAQLLPEDARLMGVDSNQQTIQWNRSHFPHISFLLSDAAPPTELSDDYDCIIAFSFFTHIPVDQQRAWLWEIIRLAKKEALIYLTTHGEYYVGQLSSQQRKQLANKGAYTNHYPVIGHRMMSTYNDANSFQQLLKELPVELAKHYPGHIYPAKAGGQDVWIIKKP